MISRMEEFQDMEEKWTVDSGKHSNGIKAVQLCSRSWRTSNTSDSRPLESRYRSQVSDTEIVLFKMVCCHIYRYPTFWK